MPQSEENPLIKEEKKNTKKLKSTLKITKKTGANGPSP